mgnify:CR=1 FL=1
MRIVSALLFILLVLFAGVQYNDPDGLLWAVIYGIPAVFCALRAFKPDLVKGDRICRTADRMARH